MASWRLIVCTGIINSILLRSRRPILQSKFLQVSAMHRGGGYGGRGYGGYYNSPFNTFINLSDLFFYWDPYYSRRQRMRQRDSTGPNFFEAIFSFGESAVHAACRLLFPAVMCGQQPK